MRRGPSSARRRRVASTVEGSGEAEGPAEADDQEPQRQAAAPQAPGHERRDGAPGGGPDEGGHRGGGGAKAGGELAVGGACDEDALLSGGHGDGRRRASGGGGTALGVSSGQLAGDKRSVRTLEAATEAYLTRVVLLLCACWHLTAWLLTSCLNYLQAAEPLDKLYSLDDAALAPEHVQFAHVAACVTFAVSFCITLTFRAWSTHCVKRSFAVSICCINWTAFATYAYHAAGRAPAVRTLDGEYMNPLRYVQWAFTTPVLLTCLSSLAGDSPEVSRIVHTAVVNDLLMIAVGAGEKFFGGGWPRVACFALSSVACVRTLSHAQQLFACARAQLSNAEDAAHIRALWRQTLTVWTFFPITRLAAIFGLLSPSGEEVAMVALDIAAKTVYSIVIMACSFTLIDAVTLTRLQRAEELLQRVRNDAASAQADVADGLTIAYREAEAWRLDRERRLINAGVPSETVAAFLDAAVAEYVALAHGRLGAWGLPTLSPNLRRPGGQHTETHTAERALL